MRALRIAFVCLCVVLLTGAGTAGLVAWHQGYRLYVVHTGSMTPTLRPGDAVLDRPAPNAVIPGEIVTFTVHSGPDSVVTHRVNSIDGDTIKTKGDANPTPDPWTLRLTQVVGSKLLTLPYGGYLLVYLQHPEGIASVLTAVLALILLWQLFFPATASPGDEPSSSRESRHRRDPVRQEIPRTSPAVTLPAPRWLEVHHPQPSFLRSGLGPIGRPADGRGYFD